MAILRIAIFFATASKFCEFIASLIKGRFGGNVNIVAETAQKKSKSLCSFFFKR